MPGKVSLPRGVMAPVAAPRADAPQRLIDKSAVGGGGGRGRYAEQVGLQAGAEVRVRISDHTSSTIWI